MTGCSDEYPGYAEVLFSRRLQLSLNLRCGHAQQVSTFAAVAARRKRQRNEVVFRDDPDKESHPLGANADLLDTATFDDVGGFLDLGQDERKLHADGLDVQLLGVFGKALDGNSVKTHQQSSDRTICLLYKRAQAISEHKFLFTGFCRQRSIASACVPRRLARTQGMWAMRRAWYGARFA